jgi:hypothetical protein
MSDVPLLSAADVAQLLFNASGMVPNQARQTDRLATKHDILEANSGKGPTKQSSPDQSASIWYQLKASSKQTKAIKCELQTRCTMHIDKIRRMSLKLDTSQNSNRKSCSIASLPSLANHASKLVLEGCRGPTPASPTPNTPEVEPPKGSNQACCFLGSRWGTEGIGEAWSARAGGPARGPPTVRGAAVCCGEATTSQRALVSSPADRTLRWVVDLRKQHARKRTKSTNHLTFVHPSSPPDEKTRPLITNLQDFGPPRPPRGTHTTPHPLEAGAFRKFSKGLVAAGWPPVCRSSPG